MAGASSALCQGWDRPGARPAVADNWHYVIYALESTTFYTQVSFQRTRQIDGLFSSPGS